MESLELDSFGLSIVPSSLVTTYCLFVEDVLDIVSDTIVVHEDAASRVQRLTQVPTASHTITVKCYISLEMCF
uniref:Uncharacterized protein n=1 Tax=Arundo donax TaxID=35708 RepID=A0A0A9GEG0_ARUDO